MTAALLRDGRGVNALRPRGVKTRHDPAPLSQAIRTLEDMLGVALFVRTKRSVKLTAVGMNLLPEVRRLLIGADGLRPLAQVSRSR